MISPRRTSIFYATNFIEKKNSRCSNFIVLYIRYCSGLLAQRPHITKGYKSLLCWLLRWTQNYWILKWIWIDLRRINIKLIKRRWMNVFHLKHFMLSHWRAIIYLIMDRNVKPIITHSSNEFYRNNFYARKPLIGLD